MAYELRPKEPVTATDRAAYALSLITDFDPASKWPRYRGVVARMAGNEKFMTALAELSKEVSHG